MTPQTNNLTSYGELKKRVREALALGRERAQGAVERERVRTAWEVGKLILEHILLNKERANYGAQVYKRLAADLEMSHTEIKFMVQFVRAYPMGPPADPLSWGHYRELLSINEDQRRKVVAREASQKNWTREILRSEIKKLNTAKEITVTEASSDELLVPIKGSLNTYRILIAKAGEWKGKPVIDLGFSNYLSLGEFFPRRRGVGTAGFKEGDIVTVENGKLKPVKNATKADLFTYQAYVFKITDGDTLWVLIKLGLGVITQQHVRLRGLDAPEIATRDGIEAKRFLERKLLTPEPIIITSTQSDKYDRYLVDIFYSTRTGEEFLNNQLLQKRLAVGV